MVGQQRTRRRRDSGLPPVRKLRAVVLSGPDAGALAEADGDGTLTVGTAPDNSLVLRDPTVSRYHLELRRATAGIALEDLGSSNGTRVGAVQVHRCLAPAGTRVAIGDDLLELTEGDLVEPQGEGEPQPLPGIVGSSEPMQAVARQVARLAGIDASVLIQGETGTGKELVAKALHQSSARAEGPFEVVDCGSLPDTLVASELFGHERGAFTGADRRHVGAFERAHGGTLFLDEVGELPPKVQPALLGVLERRRFRRVGGSEDIVVDVRVVSATHRDLRSGVNEGSFRADLYYRLAVARLHLPPLRERLEDVEDLVGFFVEELTGDPDASPFGPDAVEALRAHHWAGNVRELRNVVESALAMGQLSLDGEIVEPGGGAAGPEDTPSEPYRDARARAIARFEREYLGKLIRACDGNASKAARRASMDRPYLLTLLRKHGLR